MPISNKLNSLIDTKEQIRQAIISKGVPVSESETFRSYAAKILLIEGGGGDVPVSARFWRLRRVYSQSTSYVGLMGLLFDGDFPSVGSPVFSSQFSTSGDFSAAEAFKDNSLMWATVQGRLQELI